MENRLYTRDNCLYIIMPGEVDQYFCEKMRAGTDEFLRDPLVDTVVFDFTNVRMMDSSGIGFIAGRYQKISCVGGKTVILNATDRIKKIIVMSGLKQMVMFQNASKQEKAVKKEIYETEIGD